MNILQILPELNVGGVETGTVDFAQYLMAEGHKPVVVSNGGILVDELNRIGCAHYPLPVHKKNLITMISCVKHLVDIIQKRGYTDCACTFARAGMDCFLCLSTDEGGTGHDLSRVLYNTFF